MNRIHHTAVLGPDVELGDGNVVGPFAVLSGTVRLGSDNWIGAGTNIGAPPEIRTFQHSAEWISGSGSGVVIGDGNVIREGVQVHSGSAWQTILGDGGFIMNQVYIAHDCVLGDEVTIASSAVLGGHARVGRRANIGLHSAVHQRRVVGPLAMVGMSSVVTRDVLPYAKAFGSPCSVQGVNVRGMENAGFEAAAIERMQAFMIASSPVDLMAGDATFATDALWFREGAR